MDDKKWIWFGMFVALLCVSVMAIANLWPVNNKIGYGQFITTGMIQNRVERVEGTQSIPSGELIQPSLQPQQIGINKELAVKTVYSFKDWTTQERIDALNREYLLRKNLKVVR